jgi:hypothetical protein
MATWAWDIRSARYRDMETGRYMSRARAIELVDASLEVSASRTDTLAEMAGSDPPLISPGDWRDAMRQEIKDEYIRQYLFGRGGRDQMTPADWGSIGGMLTEQYRFLDRFAEQIADGALSTAQIRARARMYINSAREAYERGKQRAHIEARFDEVKWVLDPEAESCPDCVEFAAMEWRPMRLNPYGGAFPGDGSTQCLTNCRCRLVYRRSAEVEDV